MDNARQRMGRLEYAKVAANAQSSSTHIAVWADRAIIEPAEDARLQLCHLVSVFGGEQEIAAISAAASEASRFTLTAPQREPVTIWLGERPTVFRGAIALAGCKHAVRHLVALSDDFVCTQRGGDPGAARTVLCDGNPSFLLYRLAVRFGLPALPEWSGWFAQELARRKLVTSLVGLGCAPVLVNADKKKLLSIMSAGLKARRIAIPEDAALIRWDLPSSISITGVDCGFQCTGLTGFDPGPVSGGPPSVNTDVPPCPISNRSAIT